MVNKEEPFLPPRWQAYIGIMTESTRYTNQRWFHIHVPEFLPTTRGDLSPEYEENEISIQNIWPGKPESQKDYTPNVITPVTEQSKIKITKTIYADYFSFDTASDVPCMYRDMQVLVLNFANTDKWYWLPLERDRSLKPFDRIRFSAPDLAKAVKAEGADKDDIGARNKGLTDDNTYFLEIDTRKGHKKVKISTSASDGEKFRYFVEIDPEEHRLEIWDNCVDGSQPNNMIKIESKPNEETKGRITVQNASGNSYVMDGENTIINVPKNLVVKVGGDTVVHRGGHYSEVTDETYNKLVKGKESTTVVGITEHHFKDDYTSLYEKNKTSTIIKTNSETQDIRTTISRTASWASNESWSLSTTTMEVIAKTLTETITSITTTVEQLAITAKTSITVMAKMLTQTVNKATFSYASLMSTAAAVNIVYHINACIPIAPFFILT